ncbi:amino acid permease, partial [Streptomyces sp. CHD11]|nr:amino acid permease [Streptomyces sp. CHD11]
PAWMSRGSVAGQVPRRSLAVVSALSFLALFAVSVSGLGTEPLVLLTTGAVVAVYAVGVAAAVKLLPKGTKGRGSALGASVAVVALLVMAGVYLLWPLAVAGTALLYLRLNR